MLARAVAEAPAVACHRRHLRVKPAHPRRRRGGGSGEVSRDFMFGQQVHDAVQLIEAIVVRLWFKHGPGEDVDRDHVDMCQFHEPHIVEPGGFRPLLGVVVGPVEDGGGERLRQGISSSMLNQGQIAYESSL